jgi:PAS domain S-box-containing protein
MGRRLRPWRNSLRARLVAYFLLLSTVSVVVVGAVVYVRATDDLTTSVYDRLDAVAGIKADALDRWIDEQSRNVVFIGVVPGVGDDAGAFLEPTTLATDRTAAHDRLAAVMDALVSQTSDAEEIFILDLDGNIRLSTRPEHEGTSLAEERFFINGTSHTTAQNAYRSSLTGLPTITVASPLFDHDGNGQRVAVVAANLSLARVDQIILERTGLGETGRTYLVGLDGRLIHANVAAGDQSVAITSFGIQQALAGSSGRGLYKDYQGKPVVGIYRWLGDRDSGLIAEMSQDEAFGAARQLALTIGAVGLLSAALLAVAIWLVARQVTRPILALASTATRVTSGDLDATSGVRSEDEVGTLAVAFDEMTARLRENVATLERRVAERTAELDRQKTYFQSLVEVSPVAVVTMDAEEHVSAWNPAAQTLFGYSPEEAIGHPIDELILRTDALRDQGHEMARQATQVGRAHQTGRRMRKDGSLIDVEVLMVPLVIDGEHTGFYAIYHDITELEAARQDADAANQAKSAFLAAMSHEIRTPMNAVIGMSGLLLDTSLDPEQRDYTETINTSGEALLTIINDILDFSKIEAGRFELDSQPFALVENIEGALDVMGPIAAKKGLELAYSLDPDLPRAVVGDAGRLRQIVLNLLSNSIKFTDQGDVVLALTGRRLDLGETASAPAADLGADAERWEIQIEIRDTGIGIPAESIGRLFQSFSQADASISRRYGGTGLGLAISRRLAELMDGTLVAESAGVAGEGSTFRLVIPFPVAADAATEPVEGDQAVDLAGRRALVVDDSETNRRILTTLLQRWGLTVTETASAIEGRDLAVARDGFDIVLTDLRMPELDGMALAAAIRAAHPDGAVPVIVLSSLGQRERTTEGIAAFLTKPVKPSALHDVLVQALTGRTSRVVVADPERFTFDPDIGTRHPLRILLAEDNPVNQKLARRLLERMGYTIDLAENGLEAVEAVEHATYDLVLMDVQMPELDGLEATRRIRARWPQRSLRIVAMTANAMEGDREACLAAGMDDYLSKPIRPQELAGALAATPVGVEP